jgi:hypothetical protein
MPKELKNIIDLEDYRVSGSKVFTGRDRGIFVRDKSRIDELESIFAEISVIIPDNLYSINPSFFEELFLNVVTKLGKENFLKKFKFQCKGDYNYEKPLYEAINRILRKNSALG